MGDFRCHDKQVQNAVDMTCTSLVVGLPTIYWCQVVGYSAVVPKNYHVKHVKVRLKILTIAEYPKRAKAKGQNSNSNFQRQCIQVQPHARRRQTTRVCLPSSHTHVVTSETRSFGYSHTSDDCTEYTCQCH